MSVKCITCHITYTQCEGGSLALRLIVIISPSFLPFSTHCKLLQSEARTHRQTPTHTHTHTHTNKLSLGIRQIARPTRRMPHFHSTKVH